MVPWFNPWLSAGPALMLDESIRVVFRNHSCFHSISEQPTPVFDHSFLQLVCYTCPLTLCFQECGSIFSLLPFKVSSRISPWSFHSQSCHSATVPWSGSEQECLAFLELPWLYISRLILLKMCPSSFKMSLKLQ